jgi:formate hydrogenlyase transcriptional activator
MRTMASANRGPVRAEHANDLGLLIDSVPALIHTALPDGYIDFLNETWLKYVGRSLEDVEGWKWTASIHPDDVEEIVEKWRASLASGEPFLHEARVRRADGEYRWMLHHKIALRDEHGIIVKWHGSSIDIEDRRRAEKKVADSERDLRELIDSIPQHVMVLDANGRLLHANRMVLDYTGRTLEEMLVPEIHQRYLLDMHPADSERVERQRREGLASLAAFEIERQTLGKDGQYRWFLYRYRPMLDEAGLIVRWYCTATDIEDRKQAEGDLQKALDEIKNLRDQLYKENIALREEIVQASMFEEIVGSSESLRNVLTQVSKVARTDSTVLIFGETGTGKELIARAIHGQSNRADRAFIRVNCAAIPKDLIASELFGHEKGAFTGALQRRLGRFELADGGTIFLDEIGDLPAETQIALLRVLQEREFERVGASHSIRVDTRVLAATNRDLQEAVDSGAFRRDLYYRLNVFPIEIPPLRDRADDIPMLVEYFIARYARKVGKKVRGIQKRTLELLQSYSWPGNVRELQNVIERSLIVCETENFSVDESWLSIKPAQTRVVSQPFARLSVEQEKSLIEKALAKTEGRVSGPSGAAAQLAMPASTLESKIRSLKINKFRFKTGDTTQGN